jgi:hypothetical protein
VNLYIDLRQVVDSVKHMYSSTRSPTTPYESILTAAVHFGKKWIQAFYFCWQTSHTFLLSNY